jgi:extracellular elastinolytic metalloproteinase
MQRELDRRAPLVEANAMARDADTGDSRIVRTDPETGNAAVVAWEWGPREQGRWVERAVEYLAAAAPLLGLATGEPVEWVPDPHVQQTSSGVAIVHVGQRYKSIPIFGAAETVNFDLDGAVAGCAGAAFTVGGDLPVDPALGPEDAVTRAAAHITESDPGSLVTRAAKLRGLTWFPIAGAMHLSWDVIVTRPEDDRRFRVIVGDGDGAVLYCRDLMACVAARGLVAPKDGNGDPVMVDLPRPLADYGLPIPPDLPSGFPDDWVTGLEVAGNNAVPRPGKDGPVARGTLRDGIVTFDSTDGADRLLVNALYLCSSAHDAFYLLGFRERDRNFQADNLGRGGTPGDAVQVLVIDTVLEGDAMMDMHSSDGSAATMWLGLAPEKGGRHTALDPSIVFHEYTHGVTERLVGGDANRDPFTRRQSLGMREGWGDFFACSLLETERMGVTMTGKPGGMRSAPYDDEYPGHFGMLGTPPFDEAHTVGEVWAAALLAMSRRIGRELALRVAFDGLKLRADPSFLDGRDAILAALDRLAGGAISAEEHATARRGLWDAFARFGLGPRAATLEGANLMGAVPDFSAAPTRPGSGDRMAGAARTPGAPIVSGGEVSDVIAIDEPGPVRRIAVQVDISHPARESLRVVLRTPSGATNGSRILDPQTGTWTPAPPEVVLHRERADPGSADDLKKTWDTADWDTFVGDRPAGPLLRCEAHGEWRLSIKDMHGGKGEGRLNSWSLTLTL